jgi:hypothetical protein
MSNLNNQTKSIIPQSDNFNVTRGDIIFSAHSTPNPNAIVGSRWPGEKPFFSPIDLEDYLQFIELIILNQRLILTIPKYNDSSDVRKLGKRFVHSLDGRWIRKGKLDIEDDLVQKLWEHRILENLYLDPKTYSPKSYVQKYLTLSHYLENKQIEYEKLIVEEHKNWSNTRVKDGAILRLAYDFGNPMAISEFARDKGTPYLLDNYEISNISKLDIIELDLTRGIIPYLKKQLNEGTRYEIEQLSSIGTPLIFPKTPLAWEVIRDSNKPSDLIQVALQLREKHSNFRRDMILLEEELFSDKTTLKKKSEIMQEIKFMAKELWPKENLTYQKVSQEITDFLQLLPIDPTKSQIKDFANITGYLLAKPINVLISAYRKRKIRTLLKSRKDFLRSKLWVQKLSLIFSLPEDEIKHSLVSPHWKKVYKDIL